MARQKEIVLQHFEDMLEHYGLQSGVRNARKHLGWYIEEASGTGDEARHWRGQLCREDDPREVRNRISRFYDQQMRGGV
jgi:tRNA-dihydrouridine synthase